MKRGTKTNILLVILIITNLFNIGYNKKIVNIFSIPNDYEEETTNLVDTIFDRYEKSKEDDYYHMGVKYIRNINYYSMEIELSDFIMLGKDNKSSYENFEVIDVTIQTLEDDNLNEIYEAIVVYKYTKVKY